MALCCQTSAFLQPSSAAYSGHKSLEKTTSGPKSEQVSKSLTYMVRQG